MYKVGQNDPIVDNTKTDEDEPNKMTITGTCADGVECSITIPAGKITTIGDYYIKVPFTTDIIVDAGFKVSSTPTYTFNPASGIYGLPVANDPLTVKLI